MGSSNAGVTDDSAATFSEDAAATTETDIDIKDAVDSPPSPDSSLFSEGEKVLAFHNRYIYKAKVQKVEFRMKEWRYFVHYLGWKKNWDEWVRMDRLMKFTEENLMKQQELNKKQCRGKITKPGRATHFKPRNSSGTQGAFGLVLGHLLVFPIHQQKSTRGKKRKNNSVSKDESGVQLEKQVNIHIPSTLKKQLVDDCEFITHLGKLVKLPRSPNVDDILKNYLDYRLKKDGMIADSVREILNGLRCYFDKALSVMLLYKNERHQYDEAIADQVSPSTVYGAEHLLRLFVKLPEMLYYANIEEETLKELQQKLIDFLKFLQKKQSAFFLSTYEELEVSDASLKNQGD